MTRLSSDEARALGFVALLLALSAIARLGARPYDGTALLEAIDLSAHTEVADSALSERRRRERPLEPGERIDPNTASAVELDRLPGVGPALADRIVADREAHGPFRTTSDLARVSGVGPRMLERIAPLLELPIGPASATVADGARPVLDSPGAGPARVDPNRAGADELQTLPGVGPALAARIIAHRDSVGGFRTLDDLLAVSGIGPATLERLRPRLRLDP